MGIGIHLVAGWALLAAHAYLVAFFVPAREATIGGSYLTTGSDRVLGAAWG